MTELPEYKIVIYEISGGEIANIVRGYLEKDGEKINFTGVAYGRLGGQNFVPRFSQRAKKRLKDIFGNIRMIEEDVQRRVMVGDFEIKKEAGKS